jgi:hypothetical protein
MLTAGFGKKQNPEDHDQMGVCGETIEILINPW